MLCFLRSHNFLKLAFISNSYCSSSEQSQITAIKTEITLILFSSQSLRHVQYILLPKFTARVLILHLVEKSEGSDKSSDSNRCSPTERRQSITNHLQKLESCHRLVYSCSSRQAAFDLPSCSSPPCA